MSVCIVFRKKAQLKKKSGVPQINEQMLFHGTSSEFVEAICIHNFDWRINGIHGALFGKGNYQNSRSNSGPRSKSPLLRDNGLFCNSGGWQLLVKSYVRGSQHTLRGSEPQKSRLLHVQDRSKTFVLGRVRSCPAPSRSQGIMSMFTDFCITFNFMYKSFPWIKLKLFMSYKERTIK